MRSKNLDSKRSSFLAVYVSVVRAGAHAGPAAYEEAARLIRSHGTVPLASEEGMNRGRDADMEVLEKAAVANTGGEANTAVRVQGASCSGGAGGSSGGARSSVKRAPASRDRNKSVASRLGLAAPPAAPSSSACAMDDVQGVAQQAAGDAGASAAANAPAPRSTPTKRGARSARGTQPQGGEAGAWEAGGHMGLMEAAHVSVGGLPPMPAVAHGAMDMGAQDCGAMRPMQDMQGMRQMGQSMCAWPARPGAISGTSGSDLSNPQAHMQLLGIRVPAAGVRVMGDEASLQAHVSMQSIEHGGMAISPGLQDEPMGVANLISLDPNTRQDMLELLESLTLAPQGHPGAAAGLQHHSSGLTLGSAMTMTHMGLCSDGLAAGGGQLGRGQQQQQVLNGLAGGQLAQVFQQLQGVGRAGSTLAPPAAAAQSSGASPQQLLWEQLNMRHEARSMATASGLAGGQSAWGTAALGAPMPVMPDAQQQQQQLQLRGTQPGPMHLSMQGTVVVPSQATAAAAAPAMSGAVPHMSLMSGEEMPGSRQMSGTGSPGQQTSLGSHPAHTSMQQQPHAQQQQQCASPQHPPTRHPSVMSSQQLHVTEGGRWSSSGLAPKPSAGSMPMRLSANGVNVPIPHRLSGGLHDEWSGQGLCDPGPASAPVKQETHVPVPGYQVTTGLMPPGRTPPSVGGPWHRLSVPGSMLHPMPGCMDLDRSDPVMDRSVPAVDRSVPSKGSASAPSPQQAEQQPGTGTTITNDAATWTTTGNRELTLGQVGDSALPQTLGNSASFGRMVSEWQDELGSMEDTVLAAARLGSNDSSGQLLQAMIAAGDSFPEPQDLCFAAQGVEEPLAKHGARLDSAAGTLPVSSLLEGQGQALEPNALQPQQGQVLQSTVVGMGGADKWGCGAAATTVQGLGAPARGHHGQPTGFLGGVGGMDGRAAGNAEHQTAAGGGSARAPDMAQLQGAAQPHAHSGPQQLGAWPTPFQLGSMPGGPAAAGAHAQASRSPNPPGQACMIDDMLAAEGLDVWMGTGSGHGANSGTPHGHVGMAPAVPRNTNLHAGADTRGLVLGSDVGCLLSDVDFPVPQPVNVGRAQYRASVDGTHAQRYCSYCPCCAACSVVAMHMRLAAQLVMKPAAHCEDAPIMFAPTAALPAPYAACTLRAARAHLRCLNADLPSRFQPHAARPNPSTRTQIPKMHSTLTMQIICVHVARRRCDPHRPDQRSAACGPCERIRCQAHQQPELWGHLLPVWRPLGLQARPRLQPVVSGWCVFNC